MEQPSIWVILVGVATMLLILWMVTTSSLLRAAELLAALYPGKGFLGSLVSVLRKVAPTQNDANAKQEGLGGCLIVGVSLWLIGSGSIGMNYRLGDHDLSFALYLIPLLALLWLCGLAALSIRQGLDRPIDPGQDREAGPAGAAVGSAGSKVGAGLRRGCLPDFGALLAFLAFILALNLAVLAIFALMFLLVPPGDGGNFHGPEFKVEDQEKAPAQSPSSARPHR